MDGISPISENIRLSRSGAHQGIVVEHQSLAGGFKITASGIIVKFSDEARGILAQQREKIQTVKPPSPIDSDVYHPFK